MSLVVLVQFPNLFRSQILHNWPIFGPFGISLNRDQGLLRLNLPSPLGQDSGTLAGACVEEACSVDTNAVPDL